MHSWFLTKAFSFQEKAKKMDELKTLRNLKKKEVMEKIERIKKAAGSDEFKLGENDLEEDFDPEQHDCLMQTMFDDDYYDEDEGEEKPQWDEEVEWEGDVTA